MRRVKQFFLACQIGLLVLIVAAPLTADDTGLVGGSGGGAQRSVCPPQHRLAGLQSRIGTVMDHILPLCVPVTRDDRWGGPLVRVPGMGSSAGGNPTELSCPPDTFINGFRVTVYFDWLIRGLVTEGYTFKQYVAGVRVTCLDPTLRQIVASPLIGHAAGIFPEDAYGQARIRGGSKYPEYTKVGEWHGTQAVDCPGFTVADGIHGRAGAYVDAFGLTCQPGPPPPLAPLSVQVHTTATRPAALIEWKVPDQSGNRIIDRFVIQKRRIISGWGTWTVWDEIAAVPVPTGAQPGGRFHWNLSPNLSGQTVAVCSENLGGRVCADLVTVFVQQLQTPSTIPLATPKPEVLAMKEPPGIEAPKANERVVHGRFQLRVTRPKIGDGSIADVELTWLDGPPNQPRYINIGQVPMDELVKGVLVPDSITRRQIGRWQVRVRVAAPDVGPWSKRIPIQLALVSPLPTQPIQQQAPLPTPQISEAAQPAQQSAPPAIPQGSPIQAAPGAGKLSGSGLLQPKTMP